MKKKFNGKEIKHRKRRKLFFFVMFFLGIYFSFIMLDRSKIKIDERDFVKTLLSEGNSFLEHDDSFIKRILFYIKNIYQEPVQLLTMKQTELVEFKSKKTVPKVEKVSSELEKKPLIYIYNTHQTEEYAASSFLEYSVNPTVMMNDYILEEVFNENNLPVVVEERKIKDVLVSKGWKYNYSYQASRMLMEDAKKNYPSVKYFIDVHRDSLERDKTTVSINGKDYAKTIFLIGLENAKYEANLAFTEKINNKMNEKYPKLSKGIYKKGGPRVNGVYNQDISPTAILIEVGGYENTTSEVLNSVLAFAECFMEVIRENEG